MMVVVVLVVVRSGDGKCGYNSALQAVRQVRVGALGLVTLSACPHSPLLVPLNEKSKIEKIENRKKFRTKLASSNPFFVITKRPR